VCGDEEASASVMASTVSIDEGRVGVAIISGSVSASRRRSAGVRSSLPNARKAGLSFVTSCGVARNRKFSQGTCSGQSVPSWPEWLLIALLVFGYILPLVRWYCGDRTSRV
jgi:hypothetical protein